MGNKQGNTTNIGGADYTRLRVLGKGSFGKVYAMQHGSGTVRVIKEMNKRDISEKGSAAVHATSQERMIFSHLKGCPYVCKAFAAYQDENNLYMLLEFCSGGELEYHLNQRELFEEKDVLIYAAQLSYGLHKMHSEYHIVHRDLKPENVLLTEKGYCRLIDFNISFKCETSECNVENVNRQTVGTMPYIAPEILRGEKHSSSADWWSLGVMLFVLATGFLPFTPSSKDSSGKKKKHQMLSGILDSDMKAIFQKARTKLSKRKPPLTLSKEFESLITKLLRQNPELRLDGSKVLKHRFFDAIDWKQIETETLPRVPVIPRDDQVNFNNEANVEDIFGMEKHSKKILTKEEQAQYEDWDWVAEDQELPPLPESKKGSKKGKKK